MGRVRFGVHPQLEEKATAMILESLEGVTNREEKSDIMTPWKEKHRKSHEILVVSGTPDPAVRRGQFSKVYNPDKPQLNSRDCPTPPLKMAATWDADEGSSYGGGSLSTEMATVFGVERIEG